VTQRILVIKLAALGDFVLAFGAMKKIREAHPDAQITLLTTPPFADLARASSLFDAIETDGRPKARGDLLAMLLRLRRARYDRVYDLQTSSRSSSYFYALWPNPPQWSGIALGCSHPHANPGRDQMHTLERQADQLKFAGIWPDAPTAPGSAPSPDLSFILKSDAPRLSPEHFGLSGPYALLIPGASPHRPGKRWPVGHFAALACQLVEQGLTPVVVGGPGEAALAREIQGRCAKAVDLTGKTDFAQLAALGARAAVAIGNDTGPTHLVAAAGAPTLCLFSNESDPALCAPRGMRVAVLQAPLLADLGVSSVLSALVGFAIA
jgi:ADP-heptose:LPS heptosyltransferase